MPRTSYNTQNLTHGTRYLRIKGRLAGDDFEKVMVGVIQNFDKSIRNEVLNDGIIYMQNRAIGYVQEGKRVSLVPSDNPRSYGLEKKIRTNVKSDEKDYAEIDLSDVPYAAMHNAPLGSYTLMGVGKYMAFYWYRWRGYREVFSEGIKKPGTGFLTRAVDDTRREMPRIIRRAISYFRDSGELSISPKTGARLRGPAKLVGAKNRLRRSTKR